MDEKREREREREKERDNETCAIMMRKRKIKSRRFVFVVGVVLRRERKRKTGAHYESRTGARAVGQSPLCVSVVSLRATRRRLLLCDAICCDFSHKATLDVKATDVFFSSPPVVDQQKKERERHTQIKP